MLISSNCCHFLLLLIYAYHVHTRIIGLIKHMGLRWLNACLQQKTSKSLWEEFRVCVVNNTRSPPLLHLKIIWEKKSYLNIYIALLSADYQGLTRSFSHGMIYCSSITAKLVNLKIGIPWDKIQVLPLDQKINIAGTDVTCFDANHCPGAIIILFEPPNGKVCIKLVETLPFFKFWFWCF